MFEHKRKLINTKIFNLCVRDSLKSVEINCNQLSSFILVSQICSRDLYMYLAAVKTFTDYLKPFRIIVLGDRLSANDIKILRDKIQNIELIDINDVDTEDFPKGGTWERLLTIIDKTKEYYVIQLDSDTLSLKQMLEVKQCIEQNRSFTLGTTMGQTVIKFKEASKLMMEHQESQHVQVMAELAMEKFEDANQLKYIRGCSGFAGFAKESCNRQMLKEISQRMEILIGKHKWWEWGSEQVSSNIAVANSSNPMVLPIESYNYFKPGISIENYKFLHLIGEYRFSGGIYWRLARKLLRNA